jgi:plastocyanin
MKRIRMVAALAVVAALALVPVTQARQQKTTLNAVVGPGFTITLKKTSGVKVTTVPHGVYVIRVSDKSPIHNFHLTGPGVNKTTTVRAVGNATWTLTLKAGKYTYVCDPHVPAMKGTFRVT